MASAPFIAPLSVTSARTVRSAQVPAVVMTDCESSAPDRPVVSSSAVSRRSNEPLLSASQRIICTRPPVSVSAAFAVNVAEAPSFTTAGLGDTVTVGLDAAAVLTSTAPMRKNWPPFSNEPKASSSPPSSASTT